MYHIFFIHSSLDGHLGCFHTLAIVNSATMSIGVHVSFQIMVFSGYLPSSEIVDSMFSSKSFMVSGLTLKFLIHLKLIFVSGVR